ncbi:MAG: hypothetical protein A3H96_15590 [Acidobacteria bacterium RIFCSPLOWO2_02_FULL_67_36]|nr:MAG: hypothetical protein A3H96_15590 [Acidobacteria bacterium RIFCSPLOWO2_02_FULL_67_36]OFW19430.1 MAG: hypothetical protein A3G21_15760 [Acidobacteria bacterium RIFCSPLOWO2_12_FULL_66_21]
MSAPVLLFSLGVCIVTGLGFAILPALASSRGDVIGSLKDGARGSSTGARSRQLLAAAQVALATVLLVGAGLLVQSLLRLQRVELGFDPADITTGMMGLPPDRFKAPNSPWDSFYKPLLDRLASAPGVQAAAMSSGAPFGGGNTGMPINGVGETRMGSASLQTDWRMVSPGYFKAMRIPLLRGRYFEPSGSTDKTTLIVSATTARRMWGEADPIGRQIQAGPNGRFTIVGVVGDVRNLDLSLTPAPTMYLSTAGFLWPTMTIIVRGDERAQAPALLRNVVRDMDPQLAVFNIRQMNDLIDESAAQPRLNASLIGLFALVAALLAAIGIYGVLAYLVSQRTQEIGIRLALGAGRPAVLRLFLARGLWLAAGGLAAGVLGAVGVSRWIGSLLFDMRARDPWTIAAAAGTVALIAVLASYIPARRATRVDPLLALRSE